VSLYRETDREDVVSRLGPGHVLVASYGLVTRDVERLKAVRFATLVLDEAQAVKNAATRRARAARELEADFRLALTGTPVENHLGELWSLMRVVFPGLLGSWEMFRERFALPIERDRDSARQRALSSALRPFLLRRAKSEVARELPSRTEIDLRVALTAEERRLYDEARLAAVARLTGQADVPPEGRRFQVLAAITKLRLLACHPKLYDPETRVPSSTGWTPPGSSRPTISCRLSRRVRNRGRAMTRTQQRKTSMSRTNPRLRPRGMHPRARPFRNTTKSS
jgi:SNF2 family DNA or RNA helicase